jgi:hypothetical protein
MSNAKIPSIRTRIRQQELLAMKLAGPLQGRRAPAQATRDAKALMRRRRLDRAEKTVLRWVSGITRHRLPTTTQYCTQCGQEGQYE